MKKQEKNNKLRNNEYYDMQTTFDRLYKQSEEGKNFKNLMSIISSDENIRLAYRNIKNNTGSRTAGVDGKTMEAISKMSEQEMITKVKKLLEKYKPFPVKRVEIPKPNGNKRPLGIPTIQDRLIQQCIYQVLEPICEAKFYPQSFGFRPGRSAENAVANVYKRIQLQQLHYVVDVDIKGFFDNVNHDKLIRQMWTLGIRDKKLICIIKEILKAKIVLPNGTTIKPKKGTPQGGILSPLLANIVLNELDWWVVSNWQNVKTRREYTKTIQKNGSITEHHKYEHLKKTTNLKEMWITRYADDFKIFCRSESDAEKTYYAVKDWLERRLSLQVNAEKSGITNLKEKATEFLGFEIRAVKKGKKYVVQSNMSIKARKKVYKSLKEQIKRMQRPEIGLDVINAINRYNQIVVGTQNYYQMATMVAEDMGKIANQINKVQYNRLQERITKTGSITNKYLKKRYGKSKQVRFMDEVLICPIGYVQHKNPMAKNFKVNAYTVEGRALMHKELTKSKESILWILKHPIPSRSVEYNDNRVSRYAGQHGKCAITGEPLELHNMHLHHTVPREFGGGDKYSNLVLISEEIHILIHATKSETINKYLPLIKTTEQLEKLNKYRRKVRSEEIKKEF